MIWVIVLNPYTVSIIDEVFAVFSYSESRFPDDFTMLSNVDFAVILSPSDTADFKISAWDVFEKPMLEYYSSAFAAASFLIFERGLPLSEITFETPCGIIEVFDTGKGFLSLIIRNCKQLYTKVIEIAGCSAEYTDVYISFSARCVKTSAVHACAEDLGVHYLLHGNSVPSSALVYEIRGNVISFSYYSEHSKCKISSLAAFAAAAYTAYHKNEAGDKEILSSKSGDVLCNVGISSLNLFWKNKNSTA